MQRAATTATTTTPSSPIKQMKNSFLNLYKLMSSSTTTTTTANAASVMGSGGDDQDNNNNNGSNEVNNRNIDGGKLLRTYKLNDNKKGLCLTVAQGSVVDFRSRTGAIVNAANEGCLGGGGVDGAITAAGGINLHEDRVKIPKVQVGTNEFVRCPTGEARLTGNGEMRYNKLHVPYVIHAVGPNYMMFDEKNDVQTPHRLLYGAYYNSMRATEGTPIRKVGFSLLSAGIFRGSQSLGRVLGIGVTALKDWANHENKLEDDKDGDDKKSDGSKEKDNGGKDKEDADDEKSNVEDIVLFAFTDREAQTLLRVCDSIFGKDSPHINPTTPPPPTPTPTPTPEEKEDGCSAKDEVEKKGMEVEDSSKTETAECNAKPDQNDVAEAVDKEEDSKPELAVEDCPASETNREDKEDLPSCADEKEKDADEKKEDQPMTDSEEKQSPSDEWEVVETPKQGVDDEIMTDTEAAAAETKPEEKEEMITDSGANNKEGSPAKEEP